MEKGFSIMLNSAIPLQDLPPQGFFDNLKTVATSPLALIAYLVLIAAWAFVYFKSNRLKTIAGAIKDLPEQDRKEVLEKDYGYFLKEGMAANDFIRAQRQTYLFLGFISLLLMVTIITVITILKPNPIDSSGVALKSDSPELCKAMNKIIAGINIGFKNIEGDPDLENSTDSCKIYNSTTTLPNSTYNQIEACIDDVPTFVSALYYGRDNNIAYSRFLDFIQEFKKCAPDWIVVPGNTDKKKDITDYTSFVKGEKKVLVAYNVDSPEYFVHLLVHKIVHDDQNSAEGNPK